MRKKIFIALFMILLFVPFLSMSFYKADLSIEKRYGEQFPSLVEKGKINLGFFSQMTDYIENHFAFRQEMITADARIKASVFQSSGNSQVIVGREGWLFFQETTDDYMGRNVLSRRELHNCAKVLQLIQGAAERADAQFIFAVAPNKNSIYGEYMPKRYLPLQGSGNWEGLQREMKKLHVNYIDLFTPLRESEEKLYHKLDTHWNNLGASVACDSLLGRLGKKHTDYQSIPYTVQKSFAGDLQGMLFPKSSQLDDNIIFENEYTYQYVNEVESTEQIEIETVNPARKESLVMFRDSFGNALLPFMAEEYGTGYFTKEIPYDVSLFLDYKADDVVIELAQRQIPSLIEGVPYMIAPGIAFDGDVEETEHCDATMETENLDGVLRVSGELDRALLDDDSDIYISMVGEKNLLMFEAFPAVYDAEDESADREYSYGAYIDTEEMPEDIYQIEIITKKGETYYTTGFLREYVVK